MTGCPLILTYPEAFDPFARPRIVAALLSADSRGLIDPADGDRWMSADLNEVVGRGWGRWDRMRADRMCFVRLTDAGREMAASLSDWEFDGWDVWHSGSLVR